jgi:tetratricopeptide (TPR) repeat protein
VRQEFAPRRNLLYARDMIRGLAWPLGAAVVILVSQAPAAWAQEDTLDAAKQHYERGKELYRNEKYQEAIREFKTANELRASPILNYNIGLCQEKLGHCKAAIESFDRYLRDQPDADNRADTEHKVTELRGRMTRGECAGSRPRGQGQGQAQATPGQPSGVASGPPGEPSPGLGAALPPTGPGPDTQPPSPPAQAYRQYSVGVRLGLASGGLGSSYTDESQGPSAEQRSGVGVRVSATFPLLRLYPGARPLLSVEPFLSVLAYSFRDSAVTGASGASGPPFNGSASLVLIGAAARAGIYPIRTVPIAFAPAIGLGIGPQAYNLHALNASCSVSSTMPTVALNLDLAVRYDIATHHALYFSPADLYIVLPALSNGGNPDTTCLLPMGSTNPMATGKAVFGTDQTRVNYGLDFGYMFLF